MATKIPRFPFQSLYIDADGLIYPHAFVIAAGKQSVDQACGSLVEYLDLLVEWADKDIKTITMYTTGSGPVKFRDQFKRHIAYKEKRKKAGIKPEGVEYLQTVLYDHPGVCHIACPPEDGEADDFLAMQARTVAECGIINYCIVSNDKDLLQVPGAHAKIPSKEALKQDELNWFTVAASEAAENFYRQVLIGDSADGIPGAKGIGPARAAKVLSRSYHPEAMFDETLKAFCESYERHYDPDTVGELFFDTCNLLYLRQGLEDYFHPTKPWEDWPDDF